jgi:hypothetical protein
MAQVVRSLQLAAVRAFMIAVRGQGIVRPALAAPRPGHFLLGDSHILRFPNPVKGALEVAS